MYETLRKDPEEFDRIARMQANPTLAASAGLIPPFGRGAMNDKELEEEAFRLKPGEISKPISKDKEATIVLKCAAQIPASTDKKLADVRAHLEKEIKDRKVQDKAKEVVAELKNWRSRRRFSRTPLPQRTRRLRARARRVCSG